MFVWTELSCIVSPVDVIPTTPFRDDFFSGRLPGDPGRSTRCFCEGWIVVISTDRASRFLDLTRSERDDVGENSVTIVNHKAGKPKINEWKTRCQYNVYSHMSVLREE